MCKTQTVNVTVKNTKNDLASDHFWQKGLMSYQKELNSLSFVYSLINNSNGQVLMPE